jgi:hypothetical protein
MGNIFEAILFSFGIDSAFELAKQVVWNHDHAGRLNFRRVFIFAERIGFVFFLCFGLCLGNIGLRDNTLHHVL